MIEKELMADVFKEVEENICGCECQKSVYDCLLAVMQDVEGILNDVEVGKINREKVIDGVSNLIRCL